MAGTDDEHGDDCECAVCDSLKMGPVDLRDIPKPPPGKVGWCVFCRTVKPVDHYTAFGDNVCPDCNARIRG